ncbi:nucleoside phosphorylase domain-containing protein [Aspergillus multicolor]|uniref:nucleoside phosphorylase domain-containing protein n=1 Tax=Aspergillus multicolor TaxID=41759 RepID=UPI003CCCA2A6
MQPEPHGFEFAIICALPREFDAVEALLDERYSSLNTLRHHGDSNYYTTGRMGVSNVVLVCLLDMGKASGAGAAASLRSSFPSIRLTLLVGICGGVPFPTGTAGTELILGDAIISHQVAKFDYGRQYPDRFERRGVVKETLDRSNGPVLSLLAGLPTREMRSRLCGLLARHLAALQKDPLWVYPGVDNDRLFPASCEHNSPVEPGAATDCESVGCMGPPIPRNRLSGSDPQPWIHLGPIASGDVVMKSASHRDRLAREENVIGFEMEGAGVCEVLSSLVIKGVCDYADSHKNKKWQDYAAASGAACAKALLECLTHISYQECTLYTCSGAFQNGIGDMPSTIVAHSSSYMSRQSPADIPTRNSLASTGRIPQIKRAVPTPALEQSLVPAALGAAQIGYREMTRESPVVQSKPRRMFFGTIYYRRQIVRKQTTVGDETADQTETKTSIIFHPASWFTRLGVRYGFSAMASYQRGSWQYNLKPVYARPDDSLIFRLCETGNTEAVREMLTGGEASIHDTDTRGWSLLHFAAMAGQPRLAKFLIANGADKRAHAYEEISGYVYHHTPETFTQGTAFRQGHIQTRWQRTVDAAACA